MKKLYTATRTIAKILEVCHWVAACMMVVLLVLTLLPGDLYTSMLVQNDPHDVTVNTYGFEMTVVDSNEEFSRGALQVFAPGAAIILGLLALVFRNIYLILKTAQGETKFSKGETPFQKEVTRMIREIGIFLIAVTVVGLIFSTIATAVLGSESVRMSLDLSRIMIGLLMLCLSQVFDEGEKLRRDVDGLL